MRLHHKTNRFHLEFLEARRLLAFAAPVSHTMGGSGAGLMSVVAGDLNGDGRLDLASNGGLLMGNADGTFQRADAAYTAGGPIVGVGDFNRDEKLDLVSRVNGINLNLGNGNGTFGQPSFTNLGAACGSAAVGDINGDGTLDVMASLIEYSGYADAAVLIGNGGGSLSTLAFVNLNEYDAASSSVLADINGDGKLDFVTAQSILLGNGDGTFQPPLTTSPGGLAVGDFNGDNQVDLVSHQRVFLGQGNGTVIPGPAFPNDAYANSAVAADFNLDGKLDLAVTSYASWRTFPPGGVMILLGDGTGGFGHFQEYASGSTVPGALVAGRFNGDAFADLAVVDGGDTISILLNTGSWPVKTWIGAATGGNWSNAANWSPAACRRRAITPLSPGNPSTSATAPPSPASPSPAGRRSPSPPTAITSCAPGA